MACTACLTETVIAELKGIALDILDGSKDAETAMKFVAELKAEVSRLADFPQAARIIQRYGSYCGIWTFSFCGIACRVRWNTGVRSFYSEGFSSRASSSACVSSKRRPSMAIISISARVTS